MSCYTIHTTEEGDNEGDDDIMGDDHQDGEVEEVGVEEEEEKEGWEEEEEDLVTKKRNKERRSKLRKNIRTQLDTVSKQVHLALVKEYHCTVDKEFLKSKPLLFLSNLEAFICTQIAVCDSQSEEEEQPITIDDHGDEIYKIRGLYSSEADSYIGTKVLAPVASEFWLHLHNPVGDVLYVCYI